MRVTGLTRQQQQSSLVALNRLIKMAHDRGLNFTVGLWDHIYRGGVQFTAEVRDPAGVKRVQLRYRSVNQHQAYQTLPMLPTGRNGQYQAMIPGEQLVSGWDFMYLIEVMDNKGNGKIYPDLERDSVRRRQASALRYI